MSKIFFEFANKLLGDVKNLEKMSKKTIDLNYVVWIALDFRCCGCIPGVFAIGEPLLDEFLNSIE